MRETEDALEAIQRSKLVLFEKLADRSIDRETFKAKKAGYDVEIDRLRKRMDTLRAVVDEDDEADVDKSVLDEPKLTKEIWEKYIETVLVFPDDRISVKFKF